MNDKSKTDASADAGTSRTERLALALLDEVRKLEAGRKIHNEIEMLRFKQSLEEGSKMTPSNLHPVGGLSCNR